MKLFIVVNNDWFFLSHRAAIAVGAREAGYDVTVITRDNGFHDKVRALGVKVIDLKMNPTGMNLKEELKTVKFLYDIYKREKPDVIHHVGPKLNLWGALAARLAGAHGVVSAVSGLGVIFNGKGLMSKVMPYAFRFTNDMQNLRVIFQNNEDKATYLKHRIVNESQCRFIKGSGVDLNRFNYVPEVPMAPGDRINIIFTARMLREKGIDVIMEAARILYPEYRDKIMFQLCGGLAEEGRASYVSADELNSFGDDKYFKWMGRREDVKELLGKSHIFIFPSYYGEGLPKSCIEANAIGRPIITTDSVGCRDTVIDGYNGFIIPIKDGKALAEKLKVLIDDAALRQTMGCNARQYAVENFSIEEVVKKHLEIYAEVAK